MHGNLAVAQLSGSSCIMQTDGLVGTTFHTLQVIQEDAEENCSEHEEQSLAQLYSSIQPDIRLLLDYQGAPGAKGYAQICQLHGWSRGRKLQRKLC